VTINLKARKLIKKLSPNEQFAGHLMQNTKVQSLSDEQTFQVFCGNLMQCSIALNKIYYFDILCGNVIENV